LTIKECAKTCQQENLTDVRRNQSPDREILMMFILSAAGLSLAD
jgi:hypothetical protein